MTPGRIYAQRRYATTAIAAIAACLMLLTQSANGRPLLEQTPRPTPTPEDAAAQFGYSVALSADGTTALVGAPSDDGSAGAAWVFTRTGSTWTQQGPKLSVNEATDPDEEDRCSEEANECGFGRSVALSADGNTALIGAPGANEAQGAAWVFTRSGTTWSQLGEKLVAGEETKGNGSFGRGVALSADGSTALVGAPRVDGGHGAAWGFARTDAGFVPQGGKLTGEGEVGGGFFGRSLALSADGSTALVGGPGDNEFRGAAWAFGRSDGDWTAQGEKLVGGDEESGSGRFGFSVALSADGATGLVGARSDSAGVGAAWVLSRSGSDWSGLGSKLTATGEVGEGQFGYSAALSADGNTALIGAPHDSSLAGAAWAFTRTGATWVQQEERRAPVEDVRRLLFGTGVALAGDGNSALIGAPHEGRRLGGVWAYLGPEPIQLPPPEEEPPAKEPEGDEHTPETTTTTTTTTNQSTTGSLSPRGAVLASTSSALPAPVLAVSTNLAPLSGVVRVKLPGSKDFVLLSSAMQIPFGSIVDARHGRVSVTTAAPGGGTQTMVFYEGEFKLTQRRDGLVISALYGGSFAGCRSSAAHGRRAQASASHGKHVVRKLWAEGHGKYSTKGSYATGAVLGTRWLTEDLCEGTLIRVLTDRVAVTNLVNGKHVTVVAGHSFLAKAPHRRAH
ncbi:MAG TPA: FG-GAP repeat protein [Solirubrobacteraceae bacterium]|nr:FG-GAP repeat protein [Solirubrobacteraceae bacterium]